MSAGETSQGRKLDSEKKSVSLGKLCGSVATIPDEAQYMIKPHKEGRERAH